MPVGTAFASMAVAVYSNLTAEVAMKRRVLIILLSVVLLCILACAGLYLWWGYNNQLADQRAQALRQQVADALGRTPSDQIVEFESCGMFDCIYHVYFTSPEDPTGMDARVRALSKLHLRVGLAVARGSGESLLSGMNGALNQTRLTVTSPSTYKEPFYNYWDLQNEQGNTVCRIWFYLSKDTGVTYLFDGKPLPNANIVHLYALVFPTKD
jgi:hypothetical protein